MGLFGKKRKDSEEPVEELQEAAPAGEESPDPAAWALPADAGVTAQVTEEQPAVAETALPSEAVAAPAAGLDAEPAAVAASQDAAARAAAASAADETPPSEPAASGPATSGPAASVSGLLEHPTVQQKPELLVAGAFAGAFLVARILRRISE